MIFLKKIIIAHTTITDRLSNSLEDLDAVCRPCDALGLFVEKMMPQKAIAFTQGDNFECEISKTLDMCVGTEALGQIFASNTINSESLRLIPPTLDK